MAEVADASPPTSSGGDRKRVSRLARAPARPRPPGRHERRREEGGGGFDRPSRRRRARAGMQDDRRYGNGLGGVGGRGGDG